MQDDLASCPCGSEKIYQDCCGLYISDKEVAPTAQALMRSRYTAYSLGNIDYIEETMFGPAAEDFNASQAKAWALSANWKQLIVVNSFVQNEKLAYVEFMAFYEIDCQQKIIHEQSEFHYFQGKWRYFDGIVPKIGRNDHCPCGSGKKYKKCCAKVT